MGGGAVPARHELPRSLPPHAHLSDVRSVGSRGRARRAGRRSSRSASAAIAWTTPPITVRSRRPRRRRCATATRRSWSIPGLGIFGFARDKREARITTEFYRNAINVMSGANALEGDGDPGPVPQAKRPEHGRDFEFPQLRRAAALGGVPNRVLGARGSQASAHAAGEGIQPEGGARRRAAGSGIGRETVLELASAARTSSSPTSTWTARRRWRRRPRRSRRPRLVLATALDLGSRESMQRGDRRRRSSVRRSRRRDQHRRHLSDAAAWHAGRAGLDAGAGAQRHEQSRAGRRSGACLARPGIACDDRADQLGERRGAEVGE